MSNLVNHAWAELNRQGLFDANSDYDGMLGEAVLELITVFSKQGHSGGSAVATRDLFNRLSDFQPLSLLTNDPEEWLEVGYGLWQNVRGGEAFSEDGGKTYTILGDDEVYYSEDCGA